MILAAIALCFLEVASFRNWYGGNAVGPRYLSPALPFLGFAAAHGIQRWPKIGVMLAIVSAALMLMVTAVTIDPAQDVMTPLKDIYLVRLEQRRFAANLGTLAGLSPAASLLLLAAVDDGDRGEHRDGPVSIAPPCRVIGFAGEPLCIGG